MSNAGPLSDTFATHGVVGNDRPAVLFAEFVDQFERRFRDDRSVKTNSSLRSRRQFAGDDDHKRQGMALLQDQQLPPKEIRFDIGTLLRLDSSAELDRDFFRRDRSGVFNNKRQSLFKRVFLRDVQLLVQFKTP